MPTPNAKGKELTGSVNRKECVDSGNVMTSSLVFISVSSLEYQLYIVVSKWVMQHIQQC